VSLSFSSAQGRQSCPRKAMKALREVDSYTHSKPRHYTEVSGHFMTQPLYPWGKTAGARCTVGWSGPKHRIDILENRKICCLYSDSNPTLQPLYRLHYLGYCVQIRSVSTVNKQRLGNQDSVLGTDTAISSRSDKP
jgi:hypothetical protein